MESWDRGRALNEKEDKSICAIAVFHPNHAECVFRIRQGAGRATDEAKTGDDPVSGLGPLGWEARKAGDVAGRKDWSRAG